MEHYNAAQLVKVCTNGELLDRIALCKGVIANRDMNGQDATKTRELLAIVEAEYQRRTA